MRWLLAVLLVVGCSGDDDEGPSGDDLTGSWSGTWATSGSPPEDATLELAQEGTALSGTLGIGSAGIGADNVTATITGGQVDGQTFSADLVYDGGCTGVITLAGNVLDEGTRLAGSFLSDSDDCGGVTEGSFSFTE